MTAEAVAGAIADWLDRDDVAENRAADEVRARAAEVADAVLAALPQTGDAAAVEGLRAARETVARQTDLTELVHFERPSDFRKGVLTCIAALDAQIAALTAGGSHV